MKADKDSIGLLQEVLLKWFEKNQRPLPWRDKYEPYQVWISEIMLQQTQVKTVLPYFERWMATLPTIKSVAEAKEDQILKLWEGLGYYSRARNIQKAARQIVEEYDGVFPSDYDAILALPGVGKYTAGAIASIAFNQDRPLVDGNVIRVLSRLFLYTKNTRFPEAEKKMWKWAEEILPKGEARLFNQAMMEFGALQCTPASPDCSACPLASVCEARKENMIHLIPDRGPARRVENIKVAIAVIKKEGKVFIQKRPEKGLMGGLWEFPGGKVEKGEGFKAALQRELAEEVGMKVRNIKKIRNIKHAYTSFKVDLHCYEADYESGEVKLGSATDGLWVDPEELTNYPFPAANVRLIADLLV
ncbi:MAG: A/G-specific adenine glycosylase [Candidatus Peregrinibacteria bacterium]|nr:A/G-specific adenine glycosylase [Candidatus Peregrinibacteria bacterium]